jgi:hypothetical protein
MPKLPKIVKCLKLRMLIVFKKYMGYLFLIKYPEPLLS